MGGGSIGVRQHLDIRSNGHTATREPAHLHKDVQQRPVEGQILVADVSSHLNMTASNSTAVKNICSAIGVRQHLHIRINGLTATRMSAHLHKVVSVSVTKKEEFNVNIM